MAKLTIVTDADEKSTDVPDDTRLVLAIEQQGVNIGHRCGGYARCTTCQVEVLDGEPAGMTKAEYEILKSRDLLGQVRLSCQLVADHDMRVRPKMTVESQGWPDAGKDVEPTVTPEARWYPKSDLETGSTPA